MEYPNRAGYFVTLNGVKSFVPAKLPPDPPIQLDNEMLRLASEAAFNLGKLEDVTQILPNPNLFVAMYVQKEAVLSSQIEGTQASFADVLGAGYSQLEDRRRDDLGEISNYVSAMNWGLQELENIPLSLRLLKSIHRKLIQNTRGAERFPGEFRTSPNWIGPPGSTLNTALFVPPSVPDMRQALGDLELYCHEESDIPPLIKIALIHAQFETIHPFLDGNGRMGRLLITFWLCQQKILTKPLLYLSYYFKQNRTEYYDRLMDIRTKGNWEDWIKFFLRGVAEVAEEAVSSAKAIMELQRDCSVKLYERDSNNSHYQHLLGLLFQNPYLCRKDIISLLGVSIPTAGNILKVFCETGILTDITPERSRNKIYRFDRYVDILNKGTELHPENR